MSKYTSEDINNTIKAINQDRTLLDMLLEVDGLLEHSLEKRDINH